MAWSNTQSGQPTLLRLPHPWLAAYVVDIGAYDEGLKQFRVQPASGLRETLPQQLHKDDLSWSELTQSDGDASNGFGDGPWDRASSIPASTVRWTSGRPSIGQIWLAAYALVTLYPTVETVWIRLEGPDANRVGKELCRVRLLVERQNADQQTPSAADYIFLRGCFWQGAGSPFGPCPAWLAEASVGHWQYPLMPPHVVPAHLSDGQTVYHPQSVARRPKPTPGSTVYSRYIPHLQEHFSMVAVDPTSAEHIQLFHDWNRSGTLDQHRAYLRKLHDDQSTTALLAKLGGVFFAYFEVFWAKENYIGAHCDVEDFDRGCYTLINDAGFRSPHIMSAWWSSLLHYMFIDEPRTENVFGAARDMDSMLMGYGRGFQVGILKHIELPGRRSALASCSRELFVKICPFVHTTETTAPMIVDELAKL